MTAIVGILNKKGAVIAADSAVTVQRENGNRIYNGADKIFKLSDEHPVALAHFHQLEFMGVPIDLLVSLYRKKLGDKTFPTLRGYVDDFIDFIGKEPHCRSAEAQSGYLAVEMRDYYEQVKKYYDGSDGNAPEKSPEERIRDGMKLFAELSNELSKGDGLLKNLSFKRFKEYAKDAFDMLTDQCGKDGLPADMRTDWEQGLYDYLRCPYLLNGSGFVFTGMGDDEIYPSLIPVYVSGIVDGHLRFHFDTEEDKAIGDDCTSAICPFAQADVMMTVMSGISPDLLDKVDETAAEAVSQAREKMLEAMRDAGADEALIAKVQATELKDVTDAHEEQIQEFIRTQYLCGLVDTVVSFGIRDMVNMAESLISITSLQRHITAAEETVGGPVNVAVLTKDRGFEWAAGFWQS